MNRVEELRQLHAPGRAVPLLLRQARDGGGARSIEEAGAEAVGIPLAALAPRNARVNGMGISPDSIRAGVAAIVREVSIPVVVDFDVASAADPRWLDEAIAAAIAAGAAGIELGDGDSEPAALVARISAARAAAAGAGVDVFVTARTDLYLRGLISAELAIPAAIDRGRAYVEAGADALSIPGAFDTLHIRSIASALQTPIGVLMHDRLPALDVLATWGVRRVSEAASAMVWESAARRAAA